MSGTATLTRPLATSPPRQSALLAAPPRLGSLRGALVVVTFAAAWLAVESARQGVLSFGGAVETLGPVSGYWDAGATVIGWLLATVALLLSYRAAVALSATRSVRLGIAVAAVGAVLEAASAACSVWATAAYSHATIGGTGILGHTDASSVTHEVVQLSKASLAFQTAGYLMLAVGAFAIRAPQCRVGGSWQRVLQVLGAAALVAAVAPGVTFGYVLEGGSTTNGQLVVLMTTVPWVVCWLFVAVAMALGGVALGTSERTRRLRSAAPWAALGAVLLALSWGAIVGLDEILLEGGFGGWYTNVERVNAASSWAGWLAIAVAFGIAATRIVDRDVLLTALRQRPSVTSS
jgi:hypothetical protein